MLTFLRLFSAMGLVRYSWSLYTIYVQVVYVLYKSISISYVGRYETVRLTSIDIESLSVRESESH